MKVDMAHTVMLVERKILPKGDGGKILKRLRELDRLGPEGFHTDPQKGSFLLQVEKFLADKLGEGIGGKMHTGRSRIDQGATVERLYARDRLLDVVDRLVGLQAVIIRVAARNSKAIMPGYTHMQHAQPWVFGHYLMGLFAKLHDDFQRLNQAYGRTNINPLGTVGLAGTSWPLDRTRTTELLGFGGLVENSRLGLEAHYAIEAISALSIIMSSMNDLASDLHLWSTYEFGLVETADAYCGSSSIFPQKKNPIALETIKKAAGASTTWAATALATFRTEGTGDHAPRAVPHMDQALAHTEDTLDYMAGILDHADRAPGPHARDGRRKLVDGKQPRRRHRAHEEAVLSAGPPRGGSTGPYRHRGKLPSVRGDRRDAGSGGDGNDRQGPSLEDPRGAGRVGPRRLCRDPGDGGEHQSRRGEADDPRSKGQARRRTEMGCRPETFHRKGLRQAGASNGADRLNGRRR